MKGDDALWPIRDTEMRNKLAELEKFLKDDKLAASFQSLKQYRETALRILCEK